MKNKIRIAVYSRKSKYSDKGDSVGNQIEIAMKYIEEHYPSNQYEAEVNIFEDDGFSGGNIDRPKFKQFLIEEDRKPFNILICYRLDRISRNIADFSNLMNHITELGTSFVSIKEQFDTKTPMGRAMMYIASVFAQLEREVITERIKDNMVELAKTGRWLGGQSPTGFASKRVELVDIYEQSKDNIIEKKKKTASTLIQIDEEIEIVKKIIYKFLELKSLNKLEQYFIRNKILTKNNIDFSVSSLRTILTNPVYAPNDQDILRYFKSNNITIYADGDRAKFDGKYGLIAYGKKDGQKENDIRDWIVSVGFHKPVIKEGITWIKIQNLLQKNKEKRYRAECKHDFLFSGILKCSECGSYMRPKVAKGERFYYVCELKEKSRGKRCNSKNITGLVLDKLLIQKLGEIIVQPSDIYKELSKMSIKKYKVDIESKEEELEKKLRNNTETIKNLIFKLKYMDMEIVDFVNDELKRLKQENKQIQNQLHQLEENIQKNNIIENQYIINNCFKTFSSLDIKSRKDILKLLIGEMRGSGNEVEVKLLNTKISNNDKIMLSTE